MFYKELASMRERKALYPIEGVEDLHRFVYGYGRAVDNLKGKDADLEDFYRFMEWVQQRYNAGSSGTWYKLIQYHSANNEDSMLLFYKLFDEYIGSK